MADIDPNEEELLLDDPIEETNEEAGDTNEEGGDTTTDPDDEAEEIDDIGFADEQPDDKTDSGLVKHLREQIRERDRKLAEVSKAPPKPIEVGKKPDLWEDCEGDPDKFESELMAWQNRKSQAAAQASEQANITQKQEAEWQSAMQSYGAKKAALARSDYQDAEDTVVAALSPLQQQIIVKYTDDPAKLVYALGRSPSKLEDLAKTEDLAKFSFKVADMQRNLTVTKKKAPQPDTPVRGSGSMLKRSDKKLEALEKEAEKTNDRSKIIAYKRGLQEGKRK